MPFLLWSTTGGDTLYSDIEPISELSEPITIQIFYAQRTVYRGGVVVERQQRQYYSDRVIISSLAIFNSEPTLSGTDAGSVYINQYGDYWEVHSEITGGTGIGYYSDGILPVPGSTQTDLINFITSESIIKSNGGGATHIARRSGTLTSIGSANLSDVLMVSGGGGGGLLVGETAYEGKDAGGISGSGDNSGNQSTGYGFGQGESGSGISGGGSGLYGGYKGTSSKGGGAGSGYIGNALVSNKKMIGYNVPTSSDAGTKTESVNVYSDTREANKPKAGNGFARIKFKEYIVYKQISGTEYGQLYPSIVQDNFKIIDALDYWSPNHRFIVSNIAPILTSQTPYVVQNEMSGMPAGNYYNSAFDGDGGTIYIFCMWNSRPLVMEYQMGQPIDRHPFYDEVSGKWILICKADWGFSTSWTASNTWTSDLPLYAWNKGGMISYCQTLQNS